MHRTFHYAFALGLGVFLCLSSPLHAENPVPPKNKQQSTRDLPLTDIFSPQTAKVEALADTLEYDRINKKIIAKENVTVRRENIYLTADYAEVETEKKKVWRKGM